MPLSTLSLLSQLPLLLSNFQYGHHLLGPPPSHTTSPVLSSYINLPFLGLHLRLPQPLILLLTPPLTSLSRTLRMPATTQTSMVSSLIACQPQSHLFPHPQLPISHTMIPANPFLHPGSYSIPQMTPFSQCYYYKIIQYNSVFTNHLLHTWHITSRNAK